ncbi:MAG TPA: helix-turn-helix domain-containing GNAT family N-acetyltransferase [Gemmatimonadales bacterium]|nr:helix-turn-helix domain-containing GNAT family N-acetyltransferase [Gemmatimonadales bacterium]
MAPDPTPQPAPTAPDPAVAHIRRFNRFYTRRIGVLHEGLLDSRFSLAEVRLMYEIAHRDEPTAADLARDLDMDPGYVSRLLLGLTRRDLVARRTPGRDGRRRHLRLTAKGSKAFGELDQRSDQQVEQLLSGLSAPDRARLVGAMVVTARLLGDGSAPKPIVTLRSHRPGDMGWVVERHGTLYHAEYGWDVRFEGLVAAIVGKFIEQFDPSRERCWIAERDGERVGCVFLVKQSDQVAQLRLLLVEPAARGLGLGRTLIAETIHFARQAGYRTMELWTNSILYAARHLYEQAGFRLVRSEPHEHFGPSLVAQTWELVL